MKMKNKISAQLMRELEALRQYIKSEDEARIHKNQEYILTILALLLNPTFRNTITHWRKIYSIPRIDPIRTLNGHIEWAMNQKNDVPYQDTDEKIYSLCKACHVNPKIYGSFVIDYLYFGEVLPFRPENFNPFRFDPNITSQDEYRYRSRIELDYGMPRPDEYTENPQRAFIRVFQNTSKKGLIAFIEANWKEILKIKKQLKPYPQRKKFELFKRDIQIYLLFLLGNKVSRIAQIIQDENIPDNVSPAVQSNLEQVYSLTENRIYDRINDIDNHIRLINE